MRSSLMVQPSFTARTSIIAPSTLLSKNSIEELNNLGAKIGDDKSKINLNLSYSDSDKVYKVDYLAHFVKNRKTAITKHSTNIPTEKMSPVDYVKKLMGKLSNLYKNM